MDYASIRKPEAEKLKVFLSFRVPKSMKESIEKIAERENVKLHDLLRELIKKHIENDTDHPRN